MKREIRIVISCDWPETGDMLEDAMRQGEIAKRLKEWVGTPASEELGIRITPPQIVETRATRSEAGTKRAPKTKELRVAPEVAPALAISRPVGGGSNPPQGETKIEWATDSWNPLRARARETGKVGWFCVHKNDACANCYAEGMNRRLGTGIDYRAQDHAKVEIFLDEKMLTLPLRWKKPRKIFVCSMTDLFAEFVPDEFIDRMFAVMALCPQHTFQVLTKRPERMRAYVADTMRCENIYDHWYGLSGKPAEISAWPLPNVWLGVSVHDQESADQFIPLLLDTPAAKRFISYEPALARLNLTRLRPPGYTWLDCLEGRAHEGLGTSQGHGRLDWVIVGGESGPHARPAHPDWFRKVRDDCAAAGVPYFHKQNGEWSSRAIDGREIKITASFGSEFDVAWPDGSIRHGRAEDRGGAGVKLYRVGKKRAGRLLDGVEHNGFPPALTQIGTAHNA